MALSALVSTTGVYLSYFIDSAPAPTVVLLFALVFIVIFIYSSFKYNEKYL
ncbi:iron chelate ABC superfamily ATP binding cassette transporter (plasmid) [Klebsiella pneumoniae subsp. pneumoniae DSM 30104 = JCM 1662 = NBRC 14940]|nr:iron chelate ABC superfamily ATP binding cassette transporter [Klebsiella pneumoniae subsp. pneumoniae DSM 30104 = JCM 1662 = NBRC 14940]